MCTRKFGSTGIEAYEAHQTKASDGNAGEVCVVRGAWCVVKTQKQKTERAGSQKLEMTGSWMLAGACRQPPCPALGQHEQHEQHGALAKKKDALQTDFRNLENCSQTQPSHCESVAIWAAFGAGCSRK